MKVSMLDRIWCWWNNYCPKHFESNHEYCDSCHKEKLAAKDWKLQQIKHRYDGSIPVLLPKKED